MNFVGNLTIGAGVTDLRGGWDKIWSAFTSGWPGFATFLTVLGCVCACVAIVIIFVAARRGGQGIKQAMGAKSGGLLVIGLLLAAPSVIMPMTLGIVDWALAIAVNLYEMATNSKRGTP